MPIYRADFYLIAAVKDFDLDKSSKKILETFERIPEITNLKITKMTKDIEEFGRIRVEEWYEITGSLKIPEGSKAFLVLCKERDPNEDYNFFIRIDRNITAKDYDAAQQKAREWVDKTLAQPLREAFHVEQIEIKSPVELSSVKPRRRRE